MMIFHLLPRGVEAEAETEMSVEIASTACPSPPLLSPAFDILSKATPIFDKLKVTKFHLASG